MRGYSRGVGGAGASASTAKDPRNDPLRRHHRSHHRDARSQREHPRARGRRAVDSTRAHRRPDPRERLFVALLAGGHAGPAERPPGHRDRPARLRRHRALADRCDARRARLQRRHPRHPRRARHPHGAFRRVVDGRRCRDAVRARSPGSEPHAGVHHLALRVRGHPARRVAADGRRCRRRRRGRQPRLRSAHHRPRHVRRGADLPPQRLPLGLRRQRVRDRARGRVGRIDAHDLDGHRQLSRRQRRQ